MSDFCVGIWGRFVDVYVCEACKSDPYRELWRNLFERM